mmetsp:Transcript_47002/g.102282  ORF Transcript_47002/g.102282 Transcript_47002/m.102282 type:complete len:228 (+) Transcript_47002:55-738(+)
MFCCCGQDDSAIAEVPTAMPLSLDGRPSAVMEMPLEVAIPVLGTDQKTGHSAVEEPELQKAVEESAAPQDDTNSQAERLQQSAAEAKATLTSESQVSHSQSHTEGAAPQPDLPVQEALSSPAALTEPDPQLKSKLANEHPPHYEVDVTLVKTGPFGLDLGQESCTVLRVKVDGLVDAYNKTCPPEKQILTGSIIVAVNGKRGNAKMLLSEIARASGTTTLVVRRAQR